MKRPRHIAALLLALASSSAFAGPDIKHRLDAYENEARSLASNMPQPNAMSTGTGEKRLVDAQIAFSIGDYDQASLVLFDLVGKTSGSDHDTAAFYLGEALYQKGDRSAARGYFQQISKAGSSSKYYQPALMRLIEIAITDNDVTSGEEANLALNNMSAGLRGPGVPYVQGKWAFHLGKINDAIGLFNTVAKGSDYELQAAYYTGTVYVAQRDVGKATEVFADLVQRRPRTNNDRRVIELSQLALGRLYYEREQASKSIDAYLLVDRKSDLFPTALYEVGWVYVKNKQYDKALTALELLGRLDPQSTKTPTVKILEGNLRIRKAQMLRQAQINGTINAEERTTPADEYTKAEKIFTETHDAYYPSYMALSRMVDGTLDAASFIDQVAGRNTHVFAAAAPIPEAAAQWLREEPEVERVVNVENDLADIQRNIAEAEATITRLQGVLATGDRLTLYPSLSARRLRIAAIEHDLVGIRNQLAEDAIKAGGSSGATAQRRTLASQYAAVGNPEQAHGDRTGAVQAGYDQVGDSAQEIEKAINETQAMAVALRTYAVSGQLPDDQRTKLTTDIEDVTKEARAIEDELKSIDTEIVLGKDLAGVGDQDLIAARALRQQLMAAQNQEQIGLASRASPLAERASRLAQQLEQTDAQIDALVARGIDEIKATLESERKNVEAYKQELAELEAEARPIGADILGGSFKTVKEKLYDIVIRTDVGNVDVSWSQKEDNDDDLKRLGLAKSRDLKQLHDEFKFVLDESTRTPAQPQKKASSLPPAPTEGGSGGNSPDKGGSPDSRVKPAGDSKGGSTQPTVKPDEKKAAPTSKSTTPAKKTTTPAKKTTGGTP